jgi:DNA-binding NarL/FixJ family response regulator
MRILLVDDHPVVRQGIHGLTERLKGAVVGEAGDAASALVQVRGTGTWSSPTSRCREPTASI